MLKMAMVPQPPSLHRLQLLLSERTVVLPEITFRCRDLYLRSVDPTTWLVSWGIQLTGFESSSVLKGCYLDIPDCLPRHNPLAASLDWYREGNKTTLSIPKSAGLGPLSPEDLRSIVRLEVDGLPGVEYEQAVADGMY